MPLSVAQVDAIVDAAPDTEFTLPAYTGAPGDMAYLKNYVIAAVTTRYGVDASIFDTATLESTTILRDFVHRAVYMHPDLINYDTEAPDPFAYQSDVGGLFRDPGYWYQCGEISWQLQNIYQALGYQSAVFWQFNGEDGSGTPYSYDAGHVRVDVYLTDYDKYVTQDVTYNWLFTDSDTGQPLSFHEAQKLNFTDPSKLVFDDTGINTYYGYALNAPGVVNGFDEYYRSNYMNVTYAWMENGVDHQEQRALTPDWYDSHTTLFKGAYASASAAAAAIMALASQGKSVLGITDALRDDHEVSGFRLISMDGKSIDGDYVTVQLTDMSYVSVNVQTGAILHGSYDQIVDDLTGGGQNLNPGVDTSAFFDPAIFVQYDGNLIAEWDVDQSSAVAAPLFAEEKTRWPTVMLPDGEMRHSYTDAYSQPYDRMTDWINASGQLYFTETWYDNGDYSQTPYDWQNQASWSKFEYRFDHTGQHISTTYYNDNGSKDVTQFDVANQSWDTIALHYDAAGNLYSSMTDYDNGGYAVGKYDYQGQQVWNDWYSNYNASGVMTNELINYDNHGYLAVLYDYTNTNSWSNWQYRYNATGQIEAERIRNDNGTWSDITHDAANAYAWNIQETDYNALNHIVQKSVVNDDHSSYRTVLDAESTQIWSSGNYYYNTHGQNYQTVFYYDNGGKLVDTLDVNNAYNWSDWQVRTNAAGQKEADYVHYDDGHTVLTIYDPTNVQSYDHYVDTRDAHGNLISHVVTPDHGTFVA